ncbi:hypothetical protein V8C37DRAFT_394572 [Trichoderma ceciliae]
MMATLLDTKFMVELDDVNDEEFELRIKSFGKKQHRHFTGYDQNLPAVVYGYRHATIHGHFMDKENNRRAGTLVILDWQFLPRDPSKRFKFVRINVVFAGQGSSAGEGPAIHDIAPRGSCALLETVFTKDKTKSLGASFGTEFGASIDLSSTYELSTSTVMRDKVRITGQPYLDFKSGPEHDPDRLNAVEWNFFENKSQRSGLPTYGRTAILLSRETENEFTATFTIQAKIGKFTDIGTKLKRVLGKIDDDDPIIFNPGIKEKTAFDNDVDGLHKVNLLDQCVFVMDYKAPGHEEGAENVKA